MRVEHSMAALYEIDNVIRPVLIRSHDPRLRAQRQGVMFCELSRSYRSFPRKRESSSFFAWFWVPAFAGTSGVPSLALRLHHDLRLRHDRGELAVATRDARLQHDGRAADMQRHAFGMRGIADRNAGEEIRLALDR